MLTSDLLKGKNILFRADLDVPIEQGKVTNDFRLQALLPSLRLCLENAQSTLIIGHLGRPEAKSEQFGPSEPVGRGAESGMSRSNDVSIPKSTQFGLKPVREWLENALHRSIFFIDSGFSPGEWARGEFPLAMFDNLRFDPGELNNSREFATQLSVGCDIYVYEAFAAYNSAASLRKIPEIIPTYTGLQFDREVEELGKIVKNTDSPSLLVISGVKDDKRKYVDNFVDNHDGERSRTQFDEVLVGGRLASLVQPRPKVIPATLTGDGLDIDEASTRLFCRKIGQAKLVVINGPLGKFEDGLHAAGTKAVLAAAISSPARVTIGGGDTLAAIDALGFAYPDFDFVSTGGGAMLEFLATGTHPILEVIKNQPYAHS